MDANIEPFWVKKKKQNTTNIAVLPEGIFAVN